MAARTDITVLPYLSPRVILVADPSTELVLQDLHDTMCAWQDSPEGHDYEVIIDSAGKEDLGGGVSVGITTTLQNAVVAFQGRKSQTSSASVTTADATGVRLYDTGATFVTDGVVPGSWIVNCADGSSASALVVTETEIFTDGLDGGTDNQFDIGDDCLIYTETQCNISGGNLVAVDANGDSISAVLPTAGTQIVRTASSSATLANQRALEHATFNGGVTVDLANGVSGTLFPTGTSLQPCGNFSDALSILSDRGFTTFYVVGDATIDAGLTYDQITFIGGSKTKSEFTVTAAASVIGCEFENATITGTLDGESKIVNCVVGNLDFVDGFVEACVIEGPVTLSGTNDASFLDCWSGVIGVGKPVIDMGGTGSALALRNYNGGIRIENKTGSDAVSIDLNSGGVELHTDVTATVVDEIVVRGIGDLINNAINPENVNSDDLISGQDLTIQTEKIGRRVEGLRPNHQALGLDYYVDPANGNDSNTGRLPDDAFLTMAAALAAVTSGNNDVIWIENRTGGPTNLTERINITKNRVLIRGPGLNTSITNPDDAGPCITVDGGGVALTGFRMLPAAGAAQPLIHHTGKDHLRCEHLQLIGSTDEGIVSIGGDAHEFVNVEIGQAAGAGLRLVDTTHAKIRSCVIYEGAVEGVRLANTGPSSHLGTVIGEECVIHKNGAEAIIIDADTAGTVIHNSVHVEGPSGAILDNGTGTTNEIELRQQNVWAVDKDSPTADSVKEILLRLYQLAGLDPTNPLVVEKDGSGNPDARKVPANGSIIDQTIVDTSTETTVTRI